MAFSLVNLALSLESDNHRALISRLPLCGGAFSDICRRLICRLPDTVCDNCHFSETCDWNMLFGQRISPDSSAVKRYQKPPLPFVFSFPEVSESASSVQTIECGLIVIGRAVPQIPLLLKGFSDLLAHGFPGIRTRIASVCCRDYQGDAQAPWQFSSGKLAESVMENLVVVSMDGILEGKIWTDSRMEIRLESPLRLFENNQLVNEFQFSRFTRSIMRRVSAIAYYYGDHELEWEFKVLSGKVEEVVCVQNEFRFEKGAHHRLSGLTGHGSFEGDFVALAPLLQIGAMLHVGKGASFGMGAFDVLRQSSSR